MEPNLPHTVIKQLYCQKKAKLREQYTGALSKSRAFGTYYIENSCLMLLTEKLTIGCESKRFSYHKYPKWPPVSTLCMPSPVYDLWGHVLYCSTEGIRSFIVVNGLFTQTKVWNIETERERGSRKIEIKSKMNRKTGNWQTHHSFAVWQTDQLS